MMPLTNTLQQTTLFSSNDFTMPEHFGDDRWTILHGDVMHIVPHMTRAVFDAVITDPPYASGGASQTAKNRSTTEKYSSLRGDKALPDFDSDQMDQRSWTQWMCEWLQMVRAACKPGAPICLFIDWRQLPSMTDALQWAGWTWRGIAVWDKPSGRPQRGRFRQQAEFIVWGSNGKMPLERNVGCLPGGRILDPFAGSGTTILAAVQEGYEAVGIELTDAYFQLGTQRVKQVLESQK